MNWRKTERITKGISSHRRMGILDLLQKKPELSVVDVADILKISFKNASAHINKLAIAGLLIKRHDNNFVRHKLTDRGVAIIKFLRILN